MLSNQYLVCGITAMVSFVLGFVMYKVFIPILRRVKLGQKILDIGPSWHKSKEGTPNLGGLFFSVACFCAIAVGILVSKRDLIQYPKLLTTLGLAFGSGLIGFVDDYVKLFKKRNKGLSGTQKLVLQFALAAVYLYTDSTLCGGDTAINLPWGGTLELGIFYYVFMLIAITYIINCANLTDGIDGLAGSVALIVCVEFLLLGFEFPAFGATMYVLASALIGALLAFLVFNFYPAKIFMGDTGSMFLGGFIVGAVIMTGYEFMLLPLSVIWIIEGVSVVLQVISFKLTGKRIFKMSPIHHHFEKCGWSEIKIVAVFSTVTALFCALTHWLYMVVFTIT